MNYIRLLTAFLGVRKIRVVIVVMLDDDGRIPMDWLFTDENLATSIVIVGFCAFSIAMCLIAR